MEPFRHVRLPADVPGRLLLHSLPGRWEPLEEFRTASERESISTIVCLVPEREIAEKSPDYLAALRRGELAGEIWRFPIEDYQAPEDREAFARLLDRTVDRLRSGEAILVHCAAGIGRTGTFAAGVLVRLGLALDEAAARVRDAGSHAENPVQAGALARIPPRSEP